MGVLKYEEKIFTKPRMNNSRFDKNFKRNWTPNELDTKFLKRLMVSEYMTGK